MSSGFEVRPTDRPRDESFFVRSVVGWDVAFWAMVVIGALIVALNDLSTGERVLGVALLVVLAVAYVTFGGPAIRSRARAPSHVYRVLLVLVVTGFVLVAPPGPFLLFLAFPQIWVLSERNREGVAYTVAMVVGLALGELTRAGWTVEVFNANAAWWLISMLVSLVFGTWVSRIIEESEQRGDLIATLERTRAELAEANHAAGVVAERERIAREIHDTLAQGFTGIVAISAATQAHLESRPGADPAALERLATIEQIARDNLAEARALVAAFAPVALDGSSLADAIRRLAARFGQETGVRVDVEAHDEGAIAPAHSVVLLRATQEALANVRKHAAASHVTITLGTNPDGRTSVEVTDDGRGFEPAAAGTTGFGLLGMRGRVEEAGGELVVESAPTAGTRIQVRLPGAVVA